MKPDTAGNLAIGLGGTWLAFITPANAAIFAGVSTGLWMLCQCAGWAMDRYKAHQKDRRESRN